MAVTTYRAANFQDGLTLNMPGGTGTGTSTWTLNQSTASLPSGTFRFIVYTNLATFSTTKEICEGSVTGANTVSVTLRNAEGDTTAIDHPNGSIFAIVNTAGMENAQNDAIADLYLTGGTAVVTAGEAYSATTAVTNNNVAQAYSLPTLLQQDSTTGKWLKMAGTISLGARVRIAMAYEASSGDGASVRIYLPGSVITLGTAQTSEVGRIASNSLTSGAVESTVLPPYYSYVGWWASATTFKFEGLIFNNVNPKQIQTPVTSGEAFSVRDALYIKASDGRAYKADAVTSQESGTCYTPLFAAQAATGAAQTVLAFTPGAYITGFSGLTPGVPYYPGTAGAISTTRGKFSRVLGYAVSSTEFLFVPGKDSDDLILRGIVAGENWTVGEALYQKKSDGRYYRADTDVAESGICENPAFAFATHTGGAGSEQLVYLPGSNFFSVVSGTAGDRAYPSATTGAIALNTPPSYDTFYRVLGLFFRGNSFLFTPQEMQFLPTGIQEKGYVAAGEYAQLGQIVQVSVGVNFKKVMVNTPSSITLTSTATQYAGTPTANNITRFGFRFFVAESANPGGQQTWWAGTYQTVGN
jgi:hypothetical protein